MTVVDEAPVGETRRAFRFVSVLPVLLAGCLLAGGAGSGGSTTTPAGTPVREGLPRCDATVGQQLLAEVNRVRSGTGVAPLSVDLRLARAAATHSVDMARRGALGHRGSDGSEVHHRAERSGYDWLFIAENVASGQPTVADVMGSWMDSPGHRRNILNPQVRHFGAAVARDSAGRTYWTQVFGDTDREPDPPVGGCHP